MDCVYKTATGEARRRFRPEEKLLVHVSRPLFERVEGDVAAARAFVQDLFTFRGVEPAPRVDDSDITKIPLWQFVILVIGAAVAGDTKLKRLYAMIGQRNSGKGMLMTAVTAAFGSLVNAGKKADNLLGNDNNKDKAKKLMWLADSAFKGTHLIWTNEVRTLSLRGETFMDGNLIKK